MPSHSIERELQAFVQFATCRSERGAMHESVEPLLQESRTEVEFSQTVADVRHGIQDKAAGLSEPSDQVFAEIHQQLGLTK